jgi:PAS domain S-box-containing protein
MGLVGVAYYLTLHPLKIQITSKIFGLVFFFVMLIIFVVLPAYSIIVTREIRKRRRAEEALAKRERWFSTTLASIGDAVIATDLNGGVTFMNSVAQSLTGWSQADAAGKSMDMVFDIVNKETRGTVESPAKKVFREGKIIGLANHTILLSKGGKEFDIEDSAAPILTDTGERLGVVLVFRDITQKKLADEATKRQKDLLQLILESITDGVVVADSNGKFLVFNPAAEQVLGIGATDTTPSQWSDRYGTYLPDAVTPHPPSELPLVRAMRGETVDAAEVFIRNAKVPDGRFLSVTGGPLRGADGALHGGVVVFHDVTLQKLGQEALIQAKEEAVRASKFKDRFLSTMSHELRTPLNAVLGFSDLLADKRCGELNERQQRYVSHINTGGRHLLKLIGDILDLSKIEAGRMELSCEDLSVASIFGEVVSALRPLAEKKGQTLSSDTDRGLAIHADATRFKQVLMNLVGNAIKFTPEGGRIEITAQPENKEVQVKVRDNGPGIPAEEQKRIFDAFYRLRKSGEGVEGTGLGLAITESLVKLQGGTLGLDSELGHGSCFYFSLPAASAAREPRTPMGKLLQKTSGAAKILVIEDDATTVHLIESQLTSSGYQVVSCAQPERALEMAAEVQPQAITLDLLMKPTSGWEILLRLKQDPRTVGIPVIVITVVDNPGSGAALGADEYLVKPVDKVTLLAAVERCLEGQASSPSRPILVVEDDEPTREIITELLSGKGYAVETAADGASARQQVATSLPELVILDLMLPKVSGFELLAEWRADGRTAELPIFVLTSKDLSAQEKSYLGTHAQSLLRKQESWQGTLLKQLQRALGKPQVART